MDKGKTVSADLASAMEAVRAASAQLQDRHYAWMIGALARHCEERIEAAEAEIVRHERFRDEPLLRRYRLSEDTRVKALADARDGIDQWRTILGFVHALDRAQALASAERFAADFWAHARKGR